MLLFSRKKKNNYLLFEYYQEDQFSPWITCNFPKNVHFQLYPSTLHLKYCQNHKILKKSIFCGQITFMKGKYTINLKILNMTFCYEMWTFLFVFIRIYFDCFLLEFSACFLDK